MLGDELEIRELVQLVENILEQVEGIKLLLVLLRVLAVEVKLLAELLLVELSEPDTGLLLADGELLLVAEKLLDDLLLAVVELLIEDSLSDDLLDSLLVVGGDVRDTVVLFEIEEFLLQRVNWPVLREDFSAQPPIGVVFVEQFFFQVLDFVVFAVHEFSVFAVHLVFVFLLLGELSLLEIDLFIGIKILLFSLVLHSFLLLVVVFIVVFSSKSSIIIIIIAFAVVVLVVFIIFISVFFLVVEIGEFFILTRLIQTERLL